MKIEIIVDETIADTTITVTCKQLTSDVERLLATLRMMNHQITGKKQDELYLLDLSQIMYIESVDRKCYLYTADEVYESDFHLYELAEQLKSYGFLRISKSCLIQLRHIQSLRAEINRRIRITMNNGEQIIASRQYAEELKKRLGVI